MKESKEILSRTSVLILIAIMISLVVSQLSPLVDYFIHPEIPCFDAKHLVEGAINGVVSFILFLFIIIYFQTYRKEEEKSRALTHHYDYLAKYANDIIILFNEKLQIIEANYRMLATDGYTKDQLLQ